MEDLVESILDYIRSDYTDYAVMINGEWGSGKTHFWNNKVRKKIESMQLNGKRYTTIYMSLYGISNLEEISKKIFIETTQLMDKNLRKFMNNNEQTNFDLYYIFKNEFMLYPSEETQGVVMYFISEMSPNL